MEFVFETITTASSPEHLLEQVLGPLLPSRHQGGRGLQNHTGPSPGQAASAELSPTSAQRRWWFVNWGLSG